jgi:hypothetical protein
MTLISARSRSPTTVETSMLSSRARASAGVSTGVLPRLTTCVGPRTACAGFVATIPPVTGQSKSIRIAARRCFTEGFAKACCNVSRSISHTLSRVKSGGGVVYFLSIAGFIACKDASPFEAFSCP